LQREQLAKEIGLVKSKDDLRIRDKKREKVVKEAFAEKAAGSGSDPQFARKLAELLITDSVKIQLGKKQKDLAGKSALIIGGSGRMGAWFCRRLSNRGAGVVVWDPRGRLEGYRNVTALEPVAAAADIVVVSSPLGVCPEELGRVLDSKPKGLVFDVCSVKTHIKRQLTRAARSGLKVTSVHPMFGPTAATPEGRNVIVCACGNPKADAAASRLFASDGAKVVRTTLGQHDKLMAYVLGLSHASNLLFASVLSNSGSSLESLRLASGPSFERMLANARELSHESIRVYHDIQALNPNSNKMLSDMEKAFERLRNAAQDKDPSEFRMIMESNRRYLEVR
jgi:chorismate mutase/prephenate dehydrogenase